MLSGDYWPVHVKPLEDEALSSWIGRLATGQGLAIKTFCDLELPGKRIYATDVDLSVTLPVINALAQKTAVPVVRVLATTFAAYENNLYLNVAGRRTPKWILPVGIYTRGDGVRVLGWQSCAACLAEDRQPYFRRAWRLAFNTLCQKHGTLLRDRCPVCQAAVDIWKAPGRESIRAQDFRVGDCYYCRSALADYPNVKRPFSGLKADLQGRFQVLLNEAIVQGYASVPGYGLVYAHLYFEGLHRIVELFTKRRCSRRLRKALANHPENTHLKPMLKHLEGSFEALPIRSRHGLMRTLAWFMADWPSRYLAFCAAHRTPHTALYADRRTVPFWYWHTTYR